MPIYEYRCNSCRKVYDELVLAGREKEIRCPECRSADKSKLVSRTSFALKGDGWYRDGYGLKEASSTAVPPSS